MSRSASGRCPRAAEACFGTPQWPADRPVPQVSIEFDVANPEAVGPATRELEHAGYELLHRSAILASMANKPDLPILGLSDRGAWQAWLDANHACSEGVWLKIAKKGSSKPTVSQAEAIEEAVCFGWIDGQVGRYDGDFYLQRFTPRRTRSRWSAINRDRARRLIAEGRMKPAGLAQFVAAEADGRLEGAYAPQSTATVPEDLQAALDNCTEARAFFGSLTSADRYRFLYRLHHTKDPRRRAERIAHYIELLSERKTLA